MKGQIIKISQMKSKVNSGTAYLVIFKCDDGKSRRSWIDSGLMNYGRWQPHLRTGVVLDNLGITGNGDMIDADSYPKPIESLSKEPKAEELTPEEIAEKELKFEQGKLIDIKEVKKERDWL